MADPDDDSAVDGPDRGQREAAADRQLRPGARRHDRDDRPGGLGFRLPPIRLPPITLPPLVLPEGFRVVLPAPGVRPFTVSGPWLLAVALAFDLVDAALAVLVVGPVVTWVRVVAGIGLAALFAGVFGTLYAWEAIAVAAGLGWATVLPSLTALLLLRARR